MRTDKTARDLTNEFLRDIVAQPDSLALVLESVRADPDEVNAAASFINGAKRLVLTSMGSAYYSLFPVYRALDQFHPNVHLIETSELLHGRMRPDDTYLVMSRSGESREIVELARRLPNEPSRLGAITMTPGSTLARHAGIVVHDPATYDGQICVKAYTSMVLVGLLIAHRAEGRVMPELATNLTASFDWMRSQTEAMLDSINSMGWLGQSVSFMSHDAGMATAAAGALWFEEAVRKRAAVSLLEALAHGPIEQVDTSFYGVHIDLQPDSDGLELRSDLIAKGANLLSIMASDEPETAPEHALEIRIPTFDLPQDFRTIPAALPAQLFAYAAAASSGIDPGQMRYVGWLVS